MNLRHVILTQKDAIDVCEMVPIHTARSDGFLAAVVKRRELLEQMVERRAGLLARIVGEPQRTSIGEWCVAVDVPSPEGLLL